MPIESASYISELDVNYPLGADDRSTVDNHLRLLKLVLKTQFPNFTAAAVDLTTTQINDAVYLPGSNVNFLTFQQTTAPTGWTKATTHDNKAFRIVSGTVGSGGSVAFSTAFVSQSVSGTNTGTAISEAQMPSHTHLQDGNTVLELAGGATSANIVGGTSALGGTTQATGSGATHTHTFSGTAINLAVQYVDFILASKD